MTDKPYKLDLSTVLQAIDRRDLDFYSKLSAEEKKHYVPFILVQYMASLTDQHPMNAYAVLAANDLVNIGFWNLTNHTDLLHKLLCLTGIKGKQYRPWLTSKTAKRQGKIESWLLDQHPGLNEDELDIIKSTYDLKSWTELVKSTGIDDGKVKELVAAWKK